MKSVLIAAFILSLPTCALADDDDCIENIVGRVVCGNEAAAVRARIRAEQAFKDGKTEEYKASKSRSSFKSGSVYSSFKNTIAVRGGYIFDSSGGGTGYSGGLAYVRTVNNSPNAIKLDFELYGATDSFGATDVGALLASVVWQYEGGVVQPFISGGIGYLAATNGVYDVDGFAYQGRAGLNFQVIRRLGIETAYRYLGVTNSNGSDALHGAELNFNIDF